MRPIAGALLVLLAAAPLPAAEPGGPLFTDSIVVIGEPVYLVPIPDGKAFEVAFKVGELAIEARPIFDARLEIHATCREVSEEFCRKRVSRLSLKTKELDDRVRVELHGMSRREMKKLGVEATILVPERAPLIVKMGIGAIEVRAPWEAFGSVGLSTRIGDASLRTARDRHLEARRRMLIGAKLQWAGGPGDSHIAVKLGIGDTAVRLD